MDDKKTVNVLFVCAGNSVRSQMAEGWGKHLCNGKIYFTSAGISPSGVHPLAVETMRSVGIDISHHDSRGLDENILNRANYIITLADSIKRYSAYFPDSATHIHWSIPNPDAMCGKDLTREQAYDTVRDLIKGKIDDLLRDEFGYSIAPIA
ncbi:MAG: arsenate reductase ArsC [Candidatus Zixiibacteriota bacterium]